MAKAPASPPTHTQAALERPAADPRTRPDGRCLICERERPAVAIAHDDPFCSSTCARAHYECPLPVAEYRGPGRKGW